MTYMIRCKDCGVLPRIYISKEDIEVCSLCGGTNFEKRLENEEDVLKI